MRIKANPNLLRQKLTQLWKFNIFIQKPYKIEQTFLLLFKTIQLIKFFLTNKKPIQLQTQNQTLQKNWQKNNYNLQEISIFKLINFIIEKRNNKFLLFNNINSRTNFYTSISKQYLFDTLLFNFEKKFKIKQYRQKQTIKTYYKKLKIKKLFYFLKKIKNTKQIKITNIKPIKNKKPLKKKK